MNVTIHARRDDAAAVALADLIVQLRPDANISFLADRSRQRGPNGRAQPANGPSPEPGANGGYASAEARLLAMLATGQSVDEVGGVLGVSPPTVRVYAARARARAAKKALP
jgi:DNA-binding NarL/FixJ family response regulator